MKWKWNWNWESNFHSHFSFQFSFHFHFHFNFFGNEMKMNLKLKLKLKFKFHSHFSFQFIFDFNYDFHFIFTKTIPFMFICDWFSCWSCVLVHVQFHVHVDFELMFMLIFIFTFTFIFVFTLMLDFITWSSNETISLQMMDVFSNCLYMCCMYTSVSFWMYAMFFVITVFERMLFDVLLSVNQGWMTLHVVTHSSIPTVLTATFWKTGHFQIVFSKRLQLHVDSAYTAIVLCWQCCCWHYQLSLLLLARLRFKQTLEETRCRKKTSMACSSLEQVKNK